MNSAPHGPLINSERVAEVPLTGLSLLTDSGVMVVVRWPVHLPCLVVTDIVEKREVVRHGSEH